MNKWRKSEVLILGTTYPAYSRKYTELTCTGGLLTDTAEMVRLHPVPHRYLEPGRRPEKFQLITAELTKNVHDPRPESLRIKPGSIEKGSIISPARPEERVRYLEKSPHLIASVEELKKKQQLDGTSLGIVKPKEIVTCELEDRSEAARREWKEKERDVLAQEPLFGEKPKPIEFPATRFKVSWLCDDPQCTKPHDMGLLQWGLHELNRKLMGDPQREEKVLKRMWSELDQNERDVYLFLGSYRTIQYNFGLMDSYSAPRQRQAGTLFEP